MKRSQMLGLALAAAILALGIGWIAGLGTQEAPPAPVPADERPARDAGDRETKAPELLADEPGKAADRIVPPEPTGRTRVGGAEEEGPLLGQVVDSSARPVAGARIEAVRRGAVDLEPLADPALREEERSIGQVVTAEDGRFEFRLALGRPHRLVVTSTDFAPTVLPSVLTGERVTIVLHRGASIAGRVTRREDAAPVGGARVVIHRADSSIPLWQGTTDEDGRYSATGVEPGPLLLEVLPIEECHERATLELEEGAAVTRDLQVSLGINVAGVVKSRETGAPLAGATVSSEHFLGKAALTDRAGRYELLGLPESPTLSLSARAPGFGAHEVSLQPLDDRILTADFELTRGRAARGRVVRPDGQPVAGVYVVALGRSIDGGGMRADRVSARTGADGVFRLDGLRTDLPHTLLVRRERFAPCVVRAFDTSPGDAIELGDLVLRPGASLAGRVVTADQHGIPDAWVELASDDPSSSDPALGIGRTRLRTGADGRFHFLDLAPGRHVLQVSIVGLESREPVDLDLGEGEDRRDLEVVVGSGKLVGGRVLDPGGIGLAGAELVVRDARGSHMGSTSSGPDGRFQIAGLDPGQYELTVTYAELYGPATSRCALAEVTVPGVSPGKVDLEIVLRRVAEITGQVATPEGQGIPYALVVAVDSKEIRLDKRTADGEGRFRLRVAEDAVVELRAWRSKPNPETGRGWWADEKSIPDAMQSGVRAGELGISMVITP